MITRLIPVPATWALLALALIGPMLGHCSAVTNASASVRFELVERAIAIGESAIANPAFVNGEAWERFKQTIRDPAVQALDDPAFHQAFNAATHDLPFTHFRLHWQPRERSDNHKDELVISLSWPDDQVALVRISAFSGDPSEVTTVMNQVIERNAASLIIDLRGNTGGSFPTAVALSRTLRNEAMDAGAFLTRGWFMQHGDYPDASQYQDIPALEVLDLATFADQLQRDGAARLILPAHSEPIFEGRLFILTDRDTASTCEPLVYLLKQNGATVVGERTEGAMLSAEHFPLNDTFRLFVPVADYVTPDRVRLDKVGVVPTIQAPADQALERALQLVSK